MRRRRTKPPQWRRSRRRWWRHRPVSAVSEDWQDYAPLLAASVFSYVTGLGLSSATACTTCGSRPSWRRPCVGAQRGGLRGRSDSALAHVASAAPRPCSQASATSPPTCGGESQVTQMTQVHARRAMPRSVHAHARHAGPGARTRARAHAPAHPQTQKLERTRTRTRTHADTQTRTHTHTNTHTHTQPTRKRP